uniref:Putative secreted protein n=1 Tax=Ixodes ricinus TaxID=34613 RepID=A0A6B0US14_IXORI
MPRAVNVARCKFVLSFALVLNSMDRICGENRQTSLKGKFFCTTATGQNLMLFSHRGVQPYDFDYKSTNLKLCEFSSLAVSVASLPPPPPSPSLRSFPPPEVIIRGMCCELYRPISLTRRHPPGGHFRYGQRKK